MVAAADPGVVDGAVEAPEALDDRCDHLGDRGLVGDVGLDAMCVAADLRGHSLGCLEVDVDDGDAGAAGGRAASARLADARPGSCD